jgi:GDPmannose 4,6-dehydratase
MKAFITGITGMDGSHMKDLLISKGYEVYGVGKQSIYHIIQSIKEIKPDEIYNFASSSNVFDAWADIDYVFETDARLPQKILETIKGTDTKFFQASSCLTFGLNTDGVQNESTARCPIHPYGIAKLYADNMVSEFRRVHNIYACSGIFFNHCSPRRGNGFFAKKVCNAAAKGEMIKVGNLETVRDMGYAPDYMEAVHLMMQQNEPKDCVIGTGTLTSMDSFVKFVYEYAGLDYTKYLVVDDTLVRKNDMNVMRADTKRISDMGWQPKTSVKEMIKIMIDEQRTI